MQLLISIFFGMICACALKRDAGPSNLGYWRLVAGGVAGAFPHIDSLFYFVGSDFYFAYKNSVTWSILLMPIYANLIAFFLALISQKSWKDFVPVTLGVMITVLLMGILSTRGVQPFAPFSHFSLSLGLIYPFDLSIMGLSILALACGLLLPKFKRDIARLAIVLVIIYSVVLTTFYFKARGFAKSYAEAFNLKVEEYHIIPQPISSFNWRIMVETEDQRFHDTMVNLFRDEELELDGQDSRTNRIDSLYKPMDQAIWRVYRRYGYKNRAFAKSAWVSMYKSSDQFKELSKYWVAKDVILHNGNSCARFIDLRREGSRKSQEHTYMICRENNGAALYRPTKSGDYSLFEMIY
jgi:inner membrane protein